MPTKSIQMKLTATSQKEINSLMDILNEIESFTKYELSMCDLNSIELSKEDYPILSTFEKDNTEEFLENLLKRLSNIHFQRILWNCSTLLDNCADPNEETLEFKPDIKRGLELLAQENLKRGFATTTPDRLDIGDNVKLGNQRKYRTISNIIKLEKKEGHVPEEYDGQYLLTFNNCKQAIISQSTQLKVECIQP